MIPENVREAAAVVTDWCLSQMGPAKLMCTGGTEERHRMQVVLALGLMLDDGK